MKKIIIAIVALGMTTMASAQSNLLNSLKSVATSAAQQAASSAVSKATGSSSSTVSNVISSVASSLLGTSTVSSSSLEGTWTYSQPCVAFESSNVLTKLGSSVVSTKVQKYLNSGLTKVGFTAGKVILTFDSSSKVTISVNGKKTTGTYTVDGSDLTMKLGIGNLAKSVKMNCKVSGNSLQLAMNTTKLVTLLQAVSGKSTAASSLSTVSSLTKSVSGMYTGLQFTK